MTMTTKWMLWLICLLALTACAEAASTGRRAPLRDGGSRDGATLDGAAVPGPNQIGDACSIDADCDSATQLCATISDEGGYCSARCSAGVPCAPIDGVVADCDEDVGVCRIDCAGSGSGDGACPTNLACLESEIVAGTMAYHCQRAGTYVAPPADAGAPGPMVNAGELYSGCSADEDCASASCVEIGGVQLCSHACEAADDCPGATGSAAVPYCASLTGFDVCALACPTGSGCPTGMACTDGACLPQPASCRDGERNGDESDVDCGGPDCPKCESGATCGSAADCVSDACSCPQLSCLLTPEVCE